MSSLSNPECEPPTKAYEEAAMACALFIEDLLNVINQGATDAQAEILSSIGCTYYFGEWYAPNNIQLANYNVRV